jgi:hypothetical protein
MKATVTVAFIIGLGTHLLLHYLKCDAKGLMCDLVLFSLPTSHFALHIFWGRRRSVPNVGGGNHDKA